MILSEELEKKDKLVDFSSKIDSNSKIDFSSKEVALRTQAVDAFFVKEFFNNGFNAKRAVQTFTPSDVSSKSLERKASYLLKRNKEKILELLPSIEREADIFNKAIQAKTPENISWKDKHKYIETSFKIKGLIDTDNKAEHKVNVGLIVNK